MMSVEAPGKFQNPGSEGKEDGTAEQLLDARSCDWHVKDMIAPRLYHDCETWRLWCLVGDEKQTQN